MKPKVSVVISVYNVKPFLPDCIESLLHQTLDPIELIFVDDCSTDGSWDVLQEYLAKYPDKMKVLRSPENLRQGGARNIGIKNAAADYIGFVDSDDAVLPEMYEKLYKAATTSNADAAFCQHSSITEDFHLGGADNVHLSGMIPGVTNRKTLTIKC